MKQILFAFALLSALTLAASAAPVSCLDAVGSDVLTLTEGCSLDNYVFDNFQVSGVPNPPGSTIWLAAGTGIIDGMASLAFQITTPLPPSDTVFIYRVTGGISGVSNLMNGQGDSRIQEVVCSTQPIGNFCPVDSVLGSMVNPPTTSMTFSPQNQVWIIKDIQLPNPGTHDFISSFTNSHNAVPEPASALMMSAGLFVVAGLARRFRK